MGFWSLEGSRVPLRSLLKIEHSSNGRTGHGICVVTCLERPGSTASPSSSQSTFCGFCWGVHPVCRVCALEDSMMSAPDLFQGIREEWGVEGRNRGRQRSEQKTIIGNIWFLGGSLMASPPHYTHSSDSLVGAWRPLPLTTYTFMCFTFGTMCTYFLFLKSNYNKSLSQLHYILSSIQSVNRSLLFIFGGDLRLVLKRKKRF